MALTAVRPRVKAVNTVVIHATAGSSSAGAASVIFNGVASFHWLVPDENEPQHGHFVWATCHESRAAFHVRKSISHQKINGGQNDINRISLGIEIVNTQVSSDTFSDWQVEATAGVVRHAWAKYPNLKLIPAKAFSGSGSSGWCWKLRKSPCQSSWRWLVICRPASPAARCGSEVLPIRIL